MSQPTSWMETRVANTATNAAETEIVALSNGNFVVIWRATENTGIAISDGHDIVGQLFNPIGEPIGSEFLVAAGTERNVGNFDLAADASGGFHIVYEADAEFGASIEHKAVSFKVNGSPVIGAADTVVTDSPAVKNGDPHLVMLEDGSLQIHYQAVSSGSVASYVKTYDQGTASGTFTTIQTVNGGGLVDGEQALAAAQLKNGNVVVIRIRRTSAATRMTASSCA